MTRTIALLVLFGITLFLFGCNMPAKDGKCGYTLRSVSLGFGYEGALASLELHHCNHDAAYAEETY